MKPLSRVCLRYWPYCTAAAVGLWMVAVGQRTGRWGAAMRESVGFYDAPAEFVAASYVLFLAMTHFVWVFVVRRKRKTPKDAAVASATLVGLVLMEWFFGSTVVAVVFRSSPPLYGLGALAVTAIQKIQFPRRSSSSYLCRLTTSELVNQGYYLDPIVATSPAPGEWSMLVSVNDGRVGSSNRVVRGFSARVGDSIRIEALPGCEDATGVQAGFALTNGDIVFGNGGVPGVAFDLRSVGGPFVKLTPTVDEEYRRDPWAEADLVPFVDSGGGAAWARIGRGPVLYVYRMGDGGTLDLVVRCPFAEPQQVDQTALGVFAVRDHYLLARPSGLTLVGPAGPDEPTSVVFNNNAAESLRATDDRRVLRAASGPHETVYVALVTAKSEVTLLRLRRDGSRDDSFAPVTSSALPTMPAWRAGDFVSDGNPFKPIRQRRDTVRPLSNGDLLLFSWSHSPFRISAAGVVDVRYQQNVTASIASLGEPRAAVSILGVDAEGAVLAAFTFDPRPFGTIYEKASGVLLHILPDGTISAGGRATY